MIDIEKIKQAALAATQGEWVFGSFSELLVVPVKDGVPDKYSPIANFGETTFPWDRDSCSAERYRNAEYIATANPSTVIELITRLEAAEKDAKRYQWLLDNRSYFYQMQPDSPSECGIDFQWQQRTYAERNFAFQKPSMDTLKL